MSGAQPSEPSPAGMKTVLETIQGGADYLARHGIEQARLNMELLVAGVLGCDRMQLYVDFDRPLGERELAPLRELLKRRRHREPLQHLLGEVEFFGRRFACDRRALVPRPETEELVERVLALVRGSAGGSPPADARNRKGLVVLDLGCGSGVIGLTLAAELGREVLDGTILADVSEEALELARENARRLGGTHPAEGGGGEAEGGPGEPSGMPPLEFVVSDLFAALGGRRFDLVVANLPYVPSEEMGDLEPELAHDPARALDGGPGGTAVMRRLLEQVPEHLAPDGLVALEIGSGQGAELAVAAGEAGLRGVRCERDLSGNERFLIARAEGSAT